MAIVNTGDMIMYMNGEFIRFSEAKLPIHDRGFVYGDAAYDIARTYGHRPPKLKEHIDRLFHSLAYIQVEPGLTCDDMLEIASQVVERNVRLIDPDDDLRVILRVSRGVGMSWSQVSGPTVLVYCLPMDFAAFGRKYLDGAHVITATTRRTPPECLDPRAKLQQKLNHILAELEVRRQDPGAYALLLDVRGFLAECSAQNIFLVKGDKLFTPRDQYVLAGITRAWVLNAAAELGISYSEADLTPYDLKNADEVFITANSIALLPVAKVNHQSLKNPGVPGPVTKRLQDTFNQAVGIDVVQQALRHVGSEGSQGMRIATRIGEGG